MTVLIAPKAEPVSPGLWPAVAKSEAILHEPSEERGAKGLVTDSSPLPSKAIHNRADESCASDKTIDECQESCSFPTEPIPPRNLALSAETQLRPNLKQWRGESELGHIFGALNDAKAVVKKVGLKWQALENVIQEKKKLKVECEEGKKLLVYTRRILSEKVTNVQERADAALCQKEDLLKGERDATLATLRQKVDLLEGERDAFLATLRRKEDLIKGERDATLATLRQKEDLLKGERDAFLATQRQKEDLLKDERDAALAALQQKEVLLKGALDELKTTQGQHDGAVAELWDQMRVLEADKDSAVAESYCRMRALEAKCEAIKRESDNRVQREAEKRIVAFASEKLRMRREFHAATMVQKAQFEGELGKFLAERQRAEHEIVRVVNYLKNIPNYELQREEMKRAMELALTALAEEKSKGEKDLEGFRVLNIKLMAAQSRKRKLEGDCASLLGEKETLQRNLDEVQRRNLCQICRVTPRDAVPLPCLHLHFCSACLEKHYQLHKSCPSCKASVSGYLRCNMT